MSAMHASPPLRTHGLPMKQSVLNFQPRHSTGAATTSSDSIVVDDSDSGIETPPPPAKDKQKAKSRPPDVADDEMDDIDFTTPPRPAPTSAGHSSETHIVIDDNDDDLSDPPPMTAGSPAAKHLVKKRPSTSSTSSGPAVKKAKSSSDRKADSSTFGSDAQKPGDKKKAAPWGEGALCHQHRAVCPTDSLRCTIMRPNGKRCPLRYCDRALQTLYGTSIETIKQNGRSASSTDAADTHCAPEEASYCFKCPRCRDACDCSMCRKKSEPSSAGLAKAAQTGRKDSVISTAAKKLPPAGKSGDPVKKDKTSSKKTLQKGEMKPAKSSIAAMVASPSRPNGSGGIARQTSLPRPLKAPAAVPAPELEYIKTRLPVDNVWARAWIYETLVRFDFIRMPKAVLSQLDKFDAWTHRQLQVLLERIIAALAALPNINSGQPKARTKEVVTTFRQHGSDWSRGEPWEAARKLCENHDAYIPSLPSLDDSSDEDPHGAEEDHTPVDTGPTLLGSRVTRTRRAAELKALERVKAQSYAEYESSEDSNRDSEAEDATRRRSSRYQSSEHDDGDGDDEDDEDDDAPRGAGRRTRRRPADNARPASPEGARRSGRQRQAVQQASVPATITGTARTRGSRIVSSATDSASAGGPATPQGRASPSSSAEPSPPPAEKMPAPGREDKVAIICALLDAIMQTPEVAEELRLAPQRLIEIEKTAKDDLKEIEKDWEKVSAEIWKAAPSMVEADKFAAWKKDKEKKEREFKLRILDTKAAAYRETESLKMRSGPLGTDADGRVFWQLTEFNENMPVNTAGRWAWCVVIYGEPMTYHAPAPESMPKDVPNISPLKSKPPADGEDGDNAPSLTEECKFLSREMGDGTPSTPRKGDNPDKGKARATSSPLTPPPGLEPSAASPGKAFMGTNYPPTINEMISFIKYRAARLDYEELQAQQEQDRRAALASEAAAAEGSSLQGKAVAPVTRKAKRQLKEAQDARRKQVNDLAEKLRACRRYYLWQFAETDEGEPNVNA